MQLIVRPDEAARKYNERLACSSPEIRQALASLDVIDTKASGLGAISGLIFAGNVFLLEKGQGHSSWINFFCLIILMGAVALCCSCLWIMSPASKDLASLPETESDPASEKDAKTVGWLLKVYCARVTRYRFAFWLTLGALAGIAIALAANADLFDAH